jgi:plastocyanin
MRHGLAAAVIAVMAGSSWGCGSSAPAAPSPNNPDVLVVDIVREAGAQSFSPNPANPGARRVIFRNVDSVIHRVRLNDGSIDTGDILPGRSSNPVQMPAAGTNYHCPLHPGMVGSVQASDGAAAPPCEGLYCIP